jgi:hypothetical protein
MFYPPLPWGHICNCVADELKHQLDEGARVLLIGKLVSIDPLVKSSSSYCSPLPTSLKHNFLNSCLIHLFLGVTFVIVWQMS